MSESLYRPHRPPLLIVISGPSGVGKDTVIQRMKERRLPFHFVVTATTRPPRAGEVHGRDYFFVSKDEFAAMIESDELLEYAYVYNDYKGIPKQQVREALASGQDVIMRVDVQGAAKIRQLTANGAALIFHDHPHRRRAGGPAARAQDRNARGPQLAHRHRAQGAGAHREFDYCVINQDMTLDETVDRIMAIIEAEHSRVSPRVVHL